MKRSVLRCVHIKRLPRQKPIRPPARSATVGPCRFPRLVDAARLRVRQASPAAPRCRDLALRAAVDFGIADVLGIDGVDVTQELLHVEKEKIEKFDLSKSFNLRRRFDVALCLEVAEHLPEGSSDDHMSSIAAHSDTIFFSAASPGQPGDHHVNYQWPTYWQCLFNKNGFACHDFAALANLGRYTNSAVVPPTAPAATFC